MLRVPTQSPQGGDSDDKKNDTPEEHRHSLEKQRNKLRAEAAALDSDWRRKEREKDEIRMELRRLNDDYQRLRMDIDEREGRIKKLEGEQFLIKNDIKALNSKMYTIK